jgi:hypothetical protein
MTPSSTVDGQALERLVQQVRGVVAVRVVPDSLGQVGEIHVVADPGRSAKQMVRDVESIIYVRGGVRVDHRKISLVQIAETTLHPATVRPRLRLIDSVHDDDAAGTRVAITLGLGERVLHGESQGEAGAPENLARLAGEATLQALNDVVGDQAQLRLRQVQVNAFDGMQVCLAHVALLSDDATTSLLGVAMVRDDLVATAARATLDAVNRTLERLFA